MDKAESVVDVLRGAAGACGGGGLQPDAAARPLDRTRVTRSFREVCITPNVI